MSSPARATTSTTHTTHTTSRRRHTAISGSERQAHTRIFTLTPATGEASAAPPPAQGLSLAGMAQEREAALAASDSIAMTHAEGAQYALLSGAEEQALARRMRAGGPDAAAARDRFINANLRLVTKIAIYYATSFKRGATSLDFDDLIQEGRIGLVKAADRFDASKGYKFSTYAPWWIRQAIARALIDRGAIIRIPAYLHQRRHTLLRLRAEIETATGAQPADATLAQLLDLTPAEVREALAIHTDARSLDAVVVRNDVESVALGDLVPDPTADEQFEAAERRADVGAAPDSVLALIQRLMERGPVSRRRMQVLLRYYLAEPRPTLERIGKEMGITHERVRQLKDDGVRQLHKERKRVRAELRAQARQADQRQTNAQGR